VPYYRQILPILNLFKNKNLNSGDKIDYAQRKKAGSDHTTRPCVCDCDDYITQTTDSPPITSAAAREGVSSLHLRD